MIILPIQPGYEKLFSYKYELNKHTDPIFQHYSKYTFYIVEGKYGIYDNSSSSFLFEITREIVYE